MKHNNQLEGAALHSDVPLRLWCDFTFVSEWAEIYLPSQSVHCLTHARETQNLTRQLNKYYKHMQGWQEGRSTLMTAEITTKHIFFKFKMTTFFISFKLHSTWQTKGTWFVSGHFSSVLNLYEHYQLSIQQNVQKRLLEVECVAGPACGIICKVFIKYCH